MCCVSRALRGARGKEEPLSAIAMALLLCALCQYVTDRVTVDRVTPDTVCGLDFLVDGPFSILVRFRGIRAYGVLLC